MITYEKFFDLIAKKKFSQNELIRKKIIDPRLLNALKHNESITIKNLNKLCNKLNCTPNDILTYTPDKEEDHGQL